MKTLLCVVMFTATLFGAEAAKDAKAPVAKAPAVKAADAKVEAPKAPEVVATLSKEDIVVFAKMTNARGARFEELKVLARIDHEKQAELSEILKGLDKEFSIKADLSYSYDRKARKLFVLEKQDGKPPKSTLVREIKSDSEDTYLARQLTARQLVERQIQVIRELTDEKSKEAKIADGNLRKRFNLDPAGIYSLDADSGKILRTGTRK